MHGTDPLNERNRELLKEFVIKKCGSEEEYIKRRTTPASDPSLKAKNRKTALDDWRTLIKEGAKLTPTNAVLIAKACQCEVEELRRYLQLVPTDSTLTVCENQPDLEIELRRILGKTRIKLVSVVDFSGHTWLEGWLRDYREYVDRFRLYISTPAMAKLLGSEHQCGQFVGAMNRLVDDFKWFIESKNFFLIPYAVPPSLHGLKVEGHTTVVSLWWNCWYPEGVKTSKVITGPTASPDKIILWGDPLPHMLTTAGTKPCKDDVFRTLDGWFEDFRIRLHLAYNKGFVPEAHTLLEGLQPKAAAVIKGLLEQSRTEPP